MYDDLRHGRQQRSHRGLRRVRDLHAAGRARNGVDDDCDTLADNGFTCVPGHGRHVHDDVRLERFAALRHSCARGTCTPPVSETCNGADDDCDTAPDDGFTCAQGATGSRATTCGSSGSQLCDSSCAWGSCTPPVATCNAADDDCDTTGANGVAGPPGPTGPGATASAARGACGTYEWMR